MRGETYWLKPPRSAKGHEQSGRRPCVVVQADDLPLSTWIVVPTSRSATPTVFRPALQIAGQVTYALIEHVGAIDPAHRLGDRIGRVSAGELQEIDAALRLVLALD